MGLKYTPSSDQRPAYFYTGPMHTSKSSSLFASFKYAVTNAFLARPCAPRRPVCASLDIRGSSQGRRCHCTRARRESTHRSEPARFVCSCAVEVILSYRSPYFVDYRYVYLYAARSFAALTFYAAFSVDSMWQCSASGVFFFLFNFF